MLFTSTGGGGGHRQGSWKGRATAGSEGAWHRGLAPTPSPPPVPRPAHPSTHQNTGCSRSGGYSPALTCSHALVSVFWLCRTRPRGPCARDAASSSADPGSSGHQPRSPGYRTAVPALSTHPIPRVTAQVKGIANPCIQVRDPAVTGPRPCSGPRPLLRAAARQPGPARLWVSAPSPPPQSHCPPLLQGHPASPGPAAPPGIQRCGPPDPCLNTLSSFPLLSGNSSSRRGQQTARGSGPLFLQRQSPGASSPTCSPRGLPAGSPLWTRETARPPPPPPRMEP